MIDTFNNASSLANMTALNLQNVFPYVYPKNRQSIWVQMDHTWLVYVNLSGISCLKHTEYFFLTHWFSVMISCLQKSFLLVPNCELLKPPSLHMRTSHKTLKSPSSQECISLSYSPHFKDYWIDQSLLLNQKTVKLVTGFRGTGIYTFDAAKYFGVNITFVKFKLSGFCFGSGERPSNKFNEFVCIYQTDKQTLFYCRTRSQWSAFVGGKSTIYFKNCFSCICHGRTTRIVFNYQLIDNKILQSTVEIFHKIWHLTRNCSHFSNISIAISDTEGIDVLQMFITGHKYEYITLSANSRMQLFLHSQLDTIIKHLNQNTFLQIKYFHCFFSILQRAANSPWNTSINYTFHRITVRKYVIHGHGDKLFHTAVKLATVQNLFVNISFHNFSHFGYYSCFFGAISFFDGPIFQQTYQVCNQYPNNAPDGFTYTASSNQTLIVAHLAIRGSISISFSVECTSCQGIFLNTCARKGYPGSFTSTTRVRFRHDYGGRKTSATIVYSMFPGQWDGQDKCATHQIGAQYITTTEQRQMTECALTFYFAKNTASRMGPSWCKISVNYAKFYGKDYHFFTTKDRWRDSHEVEALFGMNTPIIPVTANVKRTPRVSVRAQCEDEFLRPKYHLSSHSLAFPTGAADTHVAKSIFNYYRQIPFNNDRLKEPNDKNYFTHFSLQSDVLFTHQAKFLDVLYSKESGLSYHKRVLTIVYKVCQASVQSLPGNSDDPKTMEKLCFPKIVGKLCLKNDKRPYIYPNMVLTLSTNQCAQPGSFGTLNFSVYLCLSTKFFENFGPRLPMDYDVLGLKVCHRWEKFQREWTSPLTNRMFLSENGLVQVDLPGKISLASLDLTNQTCCSLSFSWSKGNKQPERFSMEESADALGNKLLVEWYNGNRYSLKLVDIVWNHRDRSEKRNWIQAERICQASESHLPSFLSNSELDGFTQFIKKLATQLLVSSVFIGLQIKVKLLDITCGLLCLLWVDFYV